MSIIAISGKMQSGKNTVASIIQYLIDKKKAGYKTKNTEEDFNSYVKNKHYLKCNYQQKAFADKLKDIVCLLINCTREQLEDEVFKNTELGEEWRIWYMTHYKLSNNNSEGRIGKIYSSEEELLCYKSSDFFKSLKFDGYQIVSELLTPRKLLQLLGTECGRNIIHPNIWINALFVNYNTKKYSVGIDKYGHQTIVDKYPNWIITDLRFPNELKAIKDRNGITIRVNRTYYTKDKKYIIGHDPIQKNHESETALDNYSEWDAVIYNDTTINELILQVEDILNRFKIL